MLRYMKKIPLSRGKFALVDDDDFERLQGFKWWFNGRYATSLRYEGKKRINIWMHRVIMNTPTDLFTDHINMDRLDNRKANLRVCTKSENMHNRPAQANNTSGHKNIYWAKDKKLWTVEVKVMGVKHHIGRFSTIPEAVKARDLAYVELVGDFAWRR